MSLNNLKDNVNGILTADPGYDYWWKLIDDFEFEETESFEGGIIIEPGITLTIKNGAKLSMPVGTEEEEEETYYLNMAEPENFGTELFPNVEYATFIIEKGGIFDGVLWSDKMRDDDFILSHHAPTTLLFSKIKI